MTKILPSENLIVGKWIIVQDQLLPDTTCERIERLISNCMIELSSSEEAGDWEILYRDKNDGRLWEKFFPESELHGGGPPTLRFISETDAHRKYKF